MTRSHTLGHHFFSRPACEQRVNWHVVARPKYVRGALVARRTSFAGVPHSLLTRWVCRWSPNASECNHIHYSVWSEINQCSWKTLVVHQTFVQWALYILFKFVKSLIRHLGLAIGNVRHVRWFSWTLINYSFSNRPNLTFSQQFHRALERVQTLRMTSIILKCWIWNNFHIGIQFSYIFIWNNLSINADSKMGLYWW